MKSILLEINQASDWGFHYLAVTAALTLPDICGALESATGNFSKAAYKSWCDTWLLPNYTQVLTSDDVYMLRCGIVHAGSLGAGGMRFGRIIFTFGGNPHCNITNISNGGAFESALNLDAGIFCRDVTNAVEKWYSSKQSDRNVSTNLPRLLQLRLNGIAPNIVGIPVIA